MMGGSKMELQKDTGKAGLFLQGCGEMGKRVREFDWTGTSLGAIEGWPENLRAAVDICLGSPFASHVWWGKELVYIFNDAHGAMVGKAAAGRLGKSAREVLRDLWGMLGPQVEAVMERGESRMNERVRIEVEEGGETAERWFTWAYSPIHGEGGKVEGLMCIAMENTPEMRERQQRDLLGERRAIALNGISDLAYIFDLEGRFTFGSKPLLDFFKLPLEGLLGKNFYELGYPEGMAKKLHAEIEEVIRTRKDYVGETVYTQPPGRVGHYQHIFSPVFGEDGEVAAVAGCTRDVTEQKRAEEALRQSREQMELVVKEADVGVWYCEAPFDRLVWDGTVREHFHVGAEKEVTLELFYKRLHPEDRERVRETIAKSVAGKRPYVTEYRTISEDGKRVKWLRATGRGVCDANGVATRFDGITVDLTDIRTAENQTRTILESISDAFFALDREWRFTYMNPQGGRILGRPAAELLGKVLWEEYSGLIGSVFEPVYRGAGAGVAGKVTAFYPDYDCWYEVHVHPAPEGVSVYFRDVSERIRAEAQEKRIATEAMAAAEANAKFRTFFEQGTQFAGVMTLDGALIEANKLWLDACGFTREDVIGKKFWECGWWNRSEKLVEMVKRATRSAAAGELFREESKYFIADGSERWMELTIAPVKDESGRVLFIAPTGIDITERKKLEEEREQLLAAERGAREEAENANRAKDKFLAVLSHELRTPLSPVVMTIPSIEIDPELPFKFREELAMVRRNIELEVKLIDDLLDLSRVTSGKLRLAMQTVGAHEVVGHAIRNSVSDGSGKRVKIVEKLEAENDRLMADAARLQQVFWNLLRNAVKFTPEGGKVVVRTWNMGEKFFVEVQDTGVGIGAEILPRVFDAFEQGDARLTRQFGGLGLGLAIAKAVVEMHGGRIWAASAGKDQGSTFTVELETAPLNVMAGAVDGGSAGGVEKGIRIWRVLLVEDHPDTAVTMGRLLRGSGFDVKLAHSVAEALAAAAADTFDVVVSDLGLPDATGFELMEKLRRLYGMKGIALSGYGMEEDVRRSKEAGFAEHLVKPVNIPVLEAVLRRVAESG